MSKRSNKAKGRKPAQPKATDYSEVLAGVIELLDAARRASVRVVNSLMTATYWEIGRRIVEHEQAGEHRADYGKELIRTLSATLTVRFGRGFGAVQLSLMRQFFLTFSKDHIFQSVIEKSVGSVGPSGEPDIVQSPIEKSEIGQSAIGDFKSPGSGRPPTLERLGQIALALPLPWTHYVRLLRVRNAMAREFYAREALTGGWSVRQLHRQINSQFYERSALSKSSSANI